MKIIRILILLLCWSPSLIGQHLLQGRIVDGGTQQIVPFATVYLNGTTRGTLTDEKGQFELKVPSFPTELVVSHVGYERLVVSLQEAPSARLKVIVKPTVVELQSVKVVDDDRRKKNLAEFRSFFLGVDPLGKEASITNEEILYFERDYKERKSRVIVLNDELSESAIPTVARKVPINLKVRGNGPIIVDQPELGYKIHVDLVDFLIVYSSSVLGGTASSWLGYYYFEPYTDVNPSKQNKFDKNRERAYYNSAQHFLRSLYTQNLGLNGYKLFERVRDEATRQINYEPFDIAPFIVQGEGDEKGIKGLEGKTFEVLYYPNAKGFPRDVSKKAKGNPVNSIIQFTTDLCIVRSNGTIPDSNIRFGGLIAEKKVGAMLPDDYVPPIR